MREPSSVPTSSRFSHWEEKISVRIRKAEKVQDEERVVRWPWDHTDKKGSSG
jgi:hypothetical protein